MIYLQETASDFTLFKRQKDDILIVDSYKFTTNDESFETYKKLDCNELPENLENFINKIFSNKTEILAVRDKKLTDLILTKCKINAKFIQDDTFKLIRNNIEKFYDKMDLLKTLNLSHKMSLYKLKFCTEKLDFMIIQSINLLLDIDKDINLHCMRIREWYGVHFPELSIIVDNNEMYVKIVSVLQNKNKINIKNLQEHADVDWQEIVDLAKNSMGADISENDMSNIVNDCKSIIKNFEYRNNLSSYIKEKMQIVAPNLTNFIGDIIGARLIAKAGSLSNLAKLPGSTVQLIGAEKSLFQALRRQSNTPKYGIIFESSLLGQTPLEYKGKVARSLASKISLCARLDAYNKNQNGEFGNDAKKKILNRIKNLENSIKIKKKVITKSKFFIKPDLKYDERKDIKRIKK